MKRPRYWRQPGLFGGHVTVPKTDMLQDTAVLSLAEELERELSKAATIRLNPFAYLPKALQPATLASVVHAQKELWANLFSCDPVVRRRKARPENLTQLELL